MVTKCCFQPFENRHFRWAPISDFLNYVQDPKQDIITLQPLNEERRAILDARRIADRISKIPGHITFEHCSGQEYIEYKSQQVIYIIPNTQRTFILHPRLFHKSDDLTMMFEVKFNSVNICWSYKNYDQYFSSKDITDEHCTSVSVNKGTTLSRKTSFNWKYPCNGHPPDICNPIYFRIEAIDSGGLNCFTSQGGYPCKVANAVEITIKHQGMSCGATEIMYKTYALIFCLIILMNLH